MTTNATRPFSLSYRRRYRTGVYSMDVHAFSLSDAREAVQEFETSRGYQVTRFLDEPECTAKLSD